MRVKAILRVLLRRYSKINGNLRIFNELNSFPVLPYARTSYVFFQFFHVKPLFISSPVLTSCSRGYSSYSFQLLFFRAFWTFNNKIPFELADKLDNVCDSYACDFWENFRKIWQGPSQCHKVSLNLQRSLLTKLIVSTINVSLIFF